MGVDLEVQENPDIVDLTERWFQYLTLTVRQKETLSEDYRKNGWYEQFSKALQKKEATVDEIKEAIIVSAALATSRGIDNGNAGPLTTDIPTFIKSINAIMYELNSMLWLCDENLYKTEIREIVNMGWIFQRPALIDAIRKSITLVKLYFEAMVLIDMPKPLRVEVHKAIGSAIQIVYIYYNDINWKYHDDDIPGRCNEVPIIPDSYILTAIENSLTWACGCNKANTRKYRDQLIKEVREKKLEKLQKKTKYRLIPYRKKTISRV